MRMINHHMIERTPGTGVVHARNWFTIPTQLIDKLSLSDIGVSYPLYTVVKQCQVTLHTVLRFLSLLPMTFFQ